MKSVLKARLLLGAMLICVAIALTARAWRNENSDDNITITTRIPQQNNAGATENNSLVGLNDVIFTPAGERQIRPQLTPLSTEYIARLSNFNYLTHNIFLTDPRTKLLPTDINIPEFLEKDLTIDTSVQGPQVLIFHAHSMEMFVDSNPNDPMTGVFGVGRYLAEILANDHGIEVMHYMGRFDVVNGQPHRPGSYERLEPVIRQILEDNPSIQMVIDLHRDGVPEHLPPFVTYVDGQRTAQIMFVNGLSRRYRNGEILPVPWLPNPYQQENLALSLNLQLAANQLYPNLTRRIYLLEFRYSLHMSPLSILLEVGAQNNTLQEALNAMHPTANVIAAVVLAD